MVVLVTDKNRLRQTNTRYFGVINGAPLEAERNWEKLRQAILSKHEAGGGLLQFPQAETVYVEGQLPLRSNVDIAGHGMGNSIVHFSGDGGFEADANIADESISRFRLRDMTIRKDVESDPQNPMINLAGDEAQSYNVNEFELRGLDVDPSTDWQPKLVNSALVLSGVFTGLVSRCRLSGVDGGSDFGSLRHYPLKCTADRDGATYNNNVKFEACNIQGGHFNSWFDQSRGFKFDVCAFQGSLTGGQYFGKNVDDFLFETCWYEENAGQDIDLGYNTTSSFKNRGLTWQSCRFLDETANKSRSIKLQSYNEALWFLMCSFTGYSTSAVNNLDMTGSPPPDSNTGGMVNTILDNTPAAIDTAGSTFTERVW